MITLNLVHWWYSRNCPPIGLIFNFMLIFFVINKTPKEMRIHSRILLQTGILDILLISISILGQTVASSHSNVKIFLIDGYLTFIFENDSNLLISIFSYTFVTFTFFDIFGVTMQFIYRYLVLNRDLKINLFKYFCMLSICFLPIFIYQGRINLLTIYNAGKMPFNESGILYNEELMRKYFVGENGTAKYFVRNTKDMDIGSDTNLFIYGFIVYSLFSYMVIIICGWKISRFVNSNLTGKKKELSKQLNINLALLAILPIFYFLILTMFASLLNGIGNTEEEWMEIKTRQMYMSLTFHWMPIFNPLISIATNMPYRRALMKMFRKQIVPPNQISPGPAIITY